MALPKHRKKQFTLAQVLALADTHFQRTGQWPKVGRVPIPVHGEPGLTWENLNVALRRGWRGLPGGTSLPRLLAQARGVRSAGHAPPLHRGQISRWADVHFPRTGRWP